MEKINKIFLKEIKKNIDKEEAIKKEIVINDNYEKYYNIQALYKRIFERYLSNIANIYEKVDDKLVKSNLD